MLSLLTTTIAPPAWEIGKKTDSNESSSEEEEEDSLN
jgi:hypothetical protein